MKVLVDTPVWSLALRRRPADLNEQDLRMRETFAELISDGRAELVGLVRQEVLSGIREQRQYERLRVSLRSFPHVAITLEDYETAAKMHNECRAAGIAGSSVDFLLCAVSVRRRWSIYTLDRDFTQYSRVLPIALFQ